MKTKILDQMKVRAVKILLSDDDVVQAKKAANERGMKLQAFYGIAIRKATEEATRGARN